MNALAFVLEQAVRLWPSLAEPTTEPGFAEPPHSDPTPTYLVEATPLSWMRATGYPEL